jgi:hypothetical protein
MLKLECRRERGSSTPKKWVEDSSHALSFRPPFVADLLVGLLHRGPGHLVRDFPGTRFRAGCSGPDIPATRCRRPRDRWTAHGSVDGSSRSRANLDWSGRV